MVPQSSQVQLAFEWKKKKRSMRVDLEQISESPRNCAHNRIMQLRLDTLTSDGLGLAAFREAAKGSHESRPGRFRRSNAL